MDVNMVIPVVLFLIASVLCSNTGAEAKYNYTIVEGEDLLVLCNVSDISTGLHVYWTKNNTQNSFYQDGGKLEILDIKRTASGDYICHALNTSFPDMDVNRTIEVVTVDVQYAARITYFNLSPYTLMVNESMRISCDMEGNPAPDWALQNRDTGNSLVRMTNFANNISMTTAAKCYYSGYWECTGYNKLSAGTNVTRGHNLTVLCPPSPMVPDTNSYTVTSLPGRIAFLVLKTQGRPFPNYTWSRDDGTDMTSSVIQHDFYDTSILEFNTTTIYDYGRYTVKMENEYGFNYSRYQLKANGNPVAVRNLLASNITVDSVSLQWTPGYDMGSRQHFILFVLSQGTHDYIQLSSQIDCNYTNFVANQTCTYTYSKLNSDRQYNLTIASRNDNGFMTLSGESVKFKTKERPDGPTSGADKQTNVIVGTVVGVLGLIAIITVIIFVLKCKKAKTMQMEHEKLGKNQEKFYGSNRNGQPTGITSEL